MESTIIPLAGMITFFGSIGYIAYLFFTTRHRERMALMESDQDASIFKEYKNEQSSLKWGILAIAVGIALFLGHFLEENTTMDDGAGYFPLIFLFGGTALLIYYRMVKDKTEEI